jgi:ribosomal protein L20
MGQLNKSGVELNRKMLAEIAISDPVAFQKIIAA